MPTVCLSLDRPDVEHLWLATIWRSRKQALLQRVSRGVVFAQWSRLASKEVSRVKFAPPGFKLIVPTILQIYRGFVDHLTDTLHAQGPAVRPITQVMAFSILDPRILVWLISSSSPYTDS